MDLLMFVLITVIPVISDGLTVHGPSGPLVAPLGSSVVLPCSVDELLSVEGLEVEWRRPDSETLVHLFQDGESQTEAQQQDYQDRAHLFTDQIQHGNFSLRLDNLRAEDEGQYICNVYIHQDSGDSVVEIKVDNVEHLRVSGSKHSISASVGEDVILSCSVDSHIPPEDLEVSWMKTDEDEDIVVLLYQDHKPSPEATDERYRDRVEFFTAETLKGNFSLRLKSVRTEDKGVYMCEVFAGGLSANTTAVLEQLGFSVLHIMVLILCIFASGSALLLCSLIYCRSLCKVMKPNEQMRKCEVLYDYTAVEEDELELIVGETIEILSGKDDDGWWMGKKNDKTGLFPSNYVKEIVPPEDTVFRLQMFLVFCPNILMLLAFVLWGVSEGSLFETVSCCALYFLRPLMLLWTAPYVNEFTGNIKTWFQSYSFRTEYIVFSAVFYSVLFKSAWDKSLSYAGFEGVIIIVLFVLVLLLNLFYIIFLLDKIIGKLSQRISTIFDVLAGISLDVLPSLQFILLFYAFGSARGGFIIVAVLPLFLTVTNYDWDFTCGEQMGCSPAVRRSVYLTLMILVNAVMVYFYIIALENEKDRVGWACMIMFLQLLWAVINFTWSFKWDLPRVVAVYVFGSVGVVLLNSVALMIELIMKTVNGEGAMGDMRIVVFSSEFIFILFLMVLMVFEPWIKPYLQSCQKAIKSCQTAAAAGSQNQESQNAAAAAGSDETPAGGSNQNQNTAESHEMNPLMDKQNQENGTSDATEETQLDSVVTQK